MSNSIDTSGLDMSNPTIAAMVKEMNDLNAENISLKESKGKVGQITLKVSQKGAVSVYGLGRYPVTLYAQQMNRLLDFSDTIQEFILDNASQLNRKD